MKIIRWFLSHIFLILLVVAVIYGYMFWGNLAGDDTPAGKALAYLSEEFVEVEEFIAAVKAKQAKLTADNKPKQPELKPTPESKPTSVADVKVPVVVTEAAKENVAVNQRQGAIETLPNRQGQAAVNESDLSGFSTAMPTAKSAPAQIAQARQPIAVVSVTDETSKDTFVSADVEKQLKNVDNHGKVIDPVMQQSTVRDNWIMARKSFFQRKYDLSEKSYQNVIDSTTDNHDAYGELGNVYFNQGKKQQAASAYFEAASILVRKGQVSRARTLVGLLRQLDSAKASELQALIDSTVS